MRPIRCLLDPPWWVGLGIFMAGNLSPELPCMGPFSEFEKLRKKSLIQSFYWI